MNPTAHSEAAHEKEETPRSVTNAWLAAAIVVTIGAVVNDHLNPEASECPEETVAQAVTRNVFKVLGNPFGESEDSCFPVRRPASQTIPLNRPKAIKV